MKLAALIGFLAATTAAAAEPRAPAQRQMAIDLAYTLGEAHALHRACAGEADNTWRARMSRLLEVEAPDEPYRQRLTASFNAGFVARSAEFRACTNRSVSAEQAAARRGRDLARRLAAAGPP